MALRSGQVYQFGAGNARFMGTEEAATVGTHFTLDVLDISHCPFLCPGAASNLFPLKPAI